MESLPHDWYTELLFDPNTFHLGRPGNDFGDLGVRFCDIGVHFGDLGVHLGDLGVHFGDLGAAMVIFGLSWAFYLEYFRIRLAPLLKSSGALGVTLGAPC